MIELERTFLAKYLPANLEKCKSKEVIDIYLPTHSRHPTLRIRKNGEKYEITKKEPLANDPTHLVEETTTLKKEEFEELNSSVKGKRLHKIRYYFPYNGLMAEIDVFQGGLKGLVLIDFEFKTKEEKAIFTIPDFCLIEVKHMERLAGGMLCGKTLEDIKDLIDEHNYKLI